MAWVLRSLTAAGAALCVAIGAAAAQQVVPANPPAAADMRSGGFFIGGGAIAPDLDASPRVILGYTVPSEAWPSWLGRYARLELLGGPGGEGFGGSTQPGLALRDDSLRAYAANNQAWEMSLRFATRYALGATTSFEPALGVFAGRGGQSYEFALIEPDKLRAPDDSLGTRQVGAGLGASVQQQLANGFFATLGGTIAFVRTRSGNDCLVDALASCVPAAGLDTREGDGYRTGLGFVLGFDQGPLQIGLVADFQRQAATAGEIARAAENAYIGGLRFNFRLN